MPVPSICPRKRNARAATKSSLIPCLELQTPNHTNGSNKAFAIVSISRGRGGLLHSSPAAQSNPAGCKLHCNP
eukprot:11220899-Lingulodinium_polyedra.AAC.1